MAFKGKGKAAFKSKGTAKGAKGMTKGKGKGGGAAKGAWAWIPAVPVKPFSLKGGKGSKGKGKVIRTITKPVASARPQVFRAPMIKGKSKGKGNVVVKGKGKGKGKSSPKPVDKFLEKLKDTDASLKVWIGGLDETVSWKKLESHFKEIGKAKVAVMPKGKACLAFKTAEEVDEAIASLNGSEIDGKVIEVDVWTQREKREPGEKGEKRTKLVKTGFAAKVAKSKGKGTGKKDNKFLEQLKAMDNSEKVWVGGLTKKVTVKMLKKHFEDLGCECVVAEISEKKRTAVVGFNSSDEAASAVGGVNSTELDGKEIKVQAWGKTN